MNAAKTLPMRQKPQPPSHLGDAGRLHWDRVVTQYRLDDSELANLEAACIQLDRAAAFRSDIDERGVVVADRFGIRKPNASVQFERQALDAFRSQNRELGLSVEPPESRPPLPRGY